MQKTVEVSACITVSKKTAQTFWDGIFIVYFIFFEPYKIQIFVCSFFRKLVFMQYIISHFICGDGTKKWFEDLQKGSILAGFFCQKKKVAR